MRTSERCQVPIRTVVGSERHDPSKRPIFERFRTGAANGTATATAEVRGGGGCARARRSAPSCAGDGRATSRQSAGFRPRGNAAPQLADSHAARPARVRAVAAVAGWGTGSEKALSIRAARRKQIPHQLRGARAAAHTWNCPTHACDLGSPRVLCGRCGQAGRRGFPRAFRSSRLGSERRAGRDGEAADRSSRIEDRRDAPESCGKRSNGSRRWSRDPTSGCRQRGCRTGRRPLARDSVRSWKRKRWRSRRSCSEAGVPRPVRRILVHRNGSTIFSAVFSRPPINHEVRCRRSTIFIVRAVSGWVGGKSRRRSGKSSPGRRPVSPGRQRTSGSAGLKSQRFESRGCGRTESGLSPRTALWTVRLGRRRGRQNPCDAAAFLHYLGRA